MLVRFKKWPSLLFCTSPRAYTRTIVLSTVRPSLREIIEPLKNVIFSYYQGDYKTNDQCMSVCRQLGHYSVRARSRLYLDGFHFYYAKNIYLSCARSYYFFFKPMRYLANISKMVILGTGVIIDAGLYARALGCPSKDFVFLLNIHRNYLGTVLVWVTLYTEHLYTENNGSVIIDRILKYLTYSSIKHII